MFTGVARQLVVLEQIKRAVHENREVLITLRDHSTFLGRAPIIVDSKQIQFCCGENKLPTVLPVEKIWTVGAAVEAVAPTDTEARFASLLATCSTW
jgi:hypothetical protein